MLINLVFSGTGILSPVRGPLGVTAGRATTAAAQNLDILKYAQGD